MGEFEEIGFRVFFVGKMGKRGKNGGRRWVRNGEERPAVVRGWWVCDGWRWVWILGSDWEEENGEERGRGVRLVEKNGGNGMNSDLKIGHVSPKTECIRTYVSTFDRTCA
jgi:hypothetical protein